MSAPLTPEELRRANRPTSAYDARAFIAKARRATEAMRNRYLEVETRDETRPDGMGFGYPELDNQFLDVNLNEIDT